MELEKKLKRAGLSSSEITIYLYLLEQGLSTPSKIGKGTKIERTNTYHVLRSLKEKGLIKEAKDNGKLSYISSDPAALIRSLDEKRAAIADILPDLRARRAEEKNKPKIKFYNTWQEVKQIYYETLAAEEILAVGSTNKLQTIDNLFFENYVKEITANKIIFRDILSGSAKGESYELISQFKTGLYSANFLPSNIEDTPTDILIWGDNVALVSLDEPIFGTVLVNKNLANTFKILFKVLINKL